MHRNEEVMERQRNKETKKNKRKTRRRIEDE